MKVTAMQVLMWGCFGRFDASFEAPWNQVRVKYPGGWTREIIVPCGLHPSEWATFWN